MACAPRKHKNRPLLTEICYLRQIRSLVCLNTFSLLTLANLFKINIISYYVWLHYQITLFVFLFEKRQLDIP